ncbi:NADH-ubiquinone oxidoreductase-F iron-sulfur binding region domain-containing protein [Senegalia massiliensis]|uniref:4Fe-4S dicluster domain-containing protein n=1 Tax=Senegalia massiliensis TaxID=1720316 RepID=A0A845QTU1_9CLOT|nr:NADH-ubiquinone oxidoreductase-F iron-sulfur binding region domain-containing protein [Senegalia massiliensis]NBI05955.1 4Fe-4S dicluster domain-containing protein [Senegalia massiliensis]
MKIIVGQGSCGIAAGANKVYDKLSYEIKNNNLDIELSSTGCIGMCYLEPIIDVIHEGKKITFVNMDENKVSILLNNIYTDNISVNEFTIDKKDIEILSKQNRVALKNCGNINPESIDEYINTDGYKALEKVLKDMSPDEVIDEIKISGLKGRGGAGFPTWFKWNAAKNSPGNKKYVVCNADEGDPGAFMDRSILEGDPHRLIEGMIINGYAMGADEGIVYVRAEYPLAIKRLSNAINEAEKKGYLGENIFGENFKFSLRIKAGAGAFVCGEETALLESLQGERGMPRLKPPFPAQKGYWNKPTNINNVETLANVAYIILNGGKTFANLGTENSKGTKVFALTGKIKKGGLVEVPMGITLRDVIHEIGGGIKEDREFKAVQMGGPSGGCIPKHLLDTSVDYESISKIGAIMGSGGMVVMDETTCMVDMARFFLDFTRKESCGKCIQCRLGTKRMLEILTRICEGKGKIGDIELLEELGTKIKEGSLCGLGQTAPNPVLSTIRYFRDEYEAHIHDKKCPSKACKELVEYSISENKCIGCGLCKRNCPVEAISGEKKLVHIIDLDKCIKCGKCMEMCKFSAIKIG